MPGGGQRARLRLPVADDTGHEQVRVVEGRAVGVRERVAEFAALVDRARGLGGHMAGHPAGEGELPEQPLHAGPVPRHVRVGLAVASLQPGVGKDRRPAVPRPPHAQRVESANLDHPVEVGVHEVQAGRGAPVAEQPGLDVRGLQGLAQQRVGHEVDLADREIVGGAPVRVQGAQFLVGEGGGLGVGGVGHGDSGRRRRLPARAPVVDRWPVCVECQRISWIAAIRHAAGWCRPPSVLVRCRRGQGPIGPSAYGPGGR